MSTLDNLNLILGFQLTMGLPEIIICELGALILGFTIHFFWNSKRSLRINLQSPPTGISENDNWKLKYYNDMDMQERTQQQLRDKLSEVTENENILTIELEETRREMDELKEELELARYKLGPAKEEVPAAPQAAPVQAATPAGDYLSQ